MLSQRPAIVEAMGGKGCREGYEENRLTAEGADAAERMGGDNVIRMAAP
jgi:hypothetical protein